MSRRLLAGMFAALAILITAGLVIYFLKAGLDKADKLASVVSASIGIAALTSSLYFGMSDRQPNSPSSSQDERQASLQNRIDGGTFHGPVIQGRDISDVTFNSSEPPPSDESTHD
ncbi:hypothetical protein ACQPZZ_01500 [Microbispora sp. CA-135349]|uniref:hypothetical protein n=1 Tax=Microbispora sp. CA-135349 TaxID=3239953 RepID=UPI003D8D134F